MPVPENHEEKAKAFVAEIERALLIVAQGGPVDATNIFRERGRLVNDLRELFRDEYHRGWEEGNKDIRDRIRDFIK